MIAHETLIASGFGRWMIALYSAKKALHLCQIPAEIAGGRPPRNRRIEIFALRGGRLVPLSAAVGSRKAAACHICEFAVDAGEKAADLVQFVLLKESIPFSNPCMLSTANTIGGLFGRGKAHDIE